MNKKAIKMHNMKQETDTKFLNQQYEKIGKSVKKMCQGYSHLLFVKGRGGIGKSYRIKLALEQNNAEYVRATGEVTEAYLYRLIYENNGKIIWFNDVMKLLQNVGSLNLLKSATEVNDKRTLTKSSYSSQQADLPDKFECECSFIFDFNNLNNSVNPDFEALVSRGDYIELALCENDVKSVLNEVAKENWQKEVTKFIEENIVETEIVSLNLRTQQKAFNTRKWAEDNNLDWKKEVKREIESMTEDRVLLYSLIGKKIVTTTELKIILMKKKVVSSTRTAQRRISDWLLIGELHKWGHGQRNFYVSIDPPKR